MLPRCSGRVIGQGDTFSNPGYRQPDHPEGVQNLSVRVAFEDLRAYRNAVGQRTREVVFQLGSVDIPRKTPLARLQRLLDEGAVLRP